MSGNRAVIVAAIQNMTTNTVREAPASIMINMRAGKSGTNTDTHRIATTTIGIVTSTKESATRIDEITEVVIVNDREKIATITNTKTTSAAAIENSRASEAAETLQSTDRKSVV